MNVRHGSVYAIELVLRVTIKTASDAKAATGPRPDKAPAAPLRKGMTMKTIAKVIESMLTKDATQQWTGQTSAVDSRDGWTWGGFANDGWTWGGFSA